MAGAPEPIAPGAPAVPAQPPDQAKAVVRTDDGAGNSSEVVTIASNRSWIGSLFASGDMSVDSMIVCMIFATVSFFVLMAWQIYNARLIVGPGELGGGYAAMMVAFGGVKTARDRWGSQGPGNA